MNPVAIDLFCGAGALTYGLSEAGINVVAGVDVDQKCEYPFTENNDAEFIEKDVSKLEGDELNELYPDDCTKILVGCAPCQPYSGINTNSSKARENDERWDLLKDFGDLVEKVEPEIVVMENVPRLRNFNIYSDFIRKLWKAGYSYSAGIVDSWKYGVPQKRKRLLVLASKNGHIGLIDEEEDVTTVRDQIAHLPEIEAGEMLEEDPLHRARDLSEKNLRRIRNSVPGGTWEDWPEELVLECHKKDNGKSFGSVYGRAEWDNLGPTITTNFYNYGSGRYGHPEQDRPLSLREGAMLQTFPEDYEFVEVDEDIRFKRMGELIGNAVPPKLGEAIGRSILQHLKETDGC